MGYYTVKGNLRYTQDPKSSPVADATTAHVSEDQWLCESALWSEWVNVGTLEAETVCQLLKIRAEGLSKAMERHNDIGEITLEYCHQFHKRIISSGPPNAPWPSDPSVPFTEYGDLVASMTKETQLHIAEYAIHEASGGSFWRSQDPKNWEPLLEEV